MKIFWRWQWAMLRKSYIPTEHLSCNKRDELRVLLHIPFSFPVSLSMTITINNSLHSLDLLIVYDNMHASSIWNWRKWFVRVVFGDEIINCPPPCNIKNGCRTFCCNIKNLLHFLEKHVRKISNLPLGVCQDGQLEFLVDKNELYIDIWSTRLVRFWYTI
jgi:hypothetical protein